MFGYVKVHQPELKMGEFEHYRGMYCSLCRRLGKRYGLFAQWTLSYDFTFFALMRSALSERCAGFQKKRCPYNPLKKRTCSCDIEQLDAAADAAVLLTYHKLRDTIADDRFFKRLGARLLLPMAANDRRRCRKRRPDWDDTVARCMRQQAALEAQGCRSVDAAAEPTAELLAFLFTQDAADDKQRRVLERFGYCLGRWIYLMDAIDDLAADLKYHRYNPLALAADLHEANDEAVAAVRQQALFSLNASLAECRAAYELLKIHRFDGILRNVLEWGMPAAQRRVIYPKKGEEKTDEQSV